MGCYERRGVELHRLEPRRVLGADGRGGSGSVSLERRYTRLCFAGLCSQHHLLVVSRTGLQSSIKSHTRLPNDSLSSSSEREICCVVVNSMVVTCSLPPCRA